VLLGATRKLLGLLLLSLLLSLLLGLWLGLLMLLLLLWRRMEGVLLLHGLIDVVVDEDGSLLVFTHFGGVNAPSVPIQIRFLRKRLRTEVAFVRFITSMDAIVSVQIGFLIEGFRAVVAFEGLDSSVYSGVSVEVRLLRERLIAVGALEGFVCPRLDVKNCPLDLQRMGRVLRVHV
jgi:hypothetical protein